MVAHTRDAAPVDNDDLAAETGTTRAVSENGSDPGAPSSSRYSIRAVERTCDILDAIAAAPGPVSLADLATACSLPKGSLFRYLMTLEARRYVERAGVNGDYRLGGAFASFEVDHFARLAELAEPRLRALRDEFGETTNLGMLSGAKVAYLRIEESKSNVRLAARLNDRDELHCTALGKAIIAAMPDSAVTSLIGVSYTQRTPHTIVGWPGLKQELDLIRRQGYAMDNEESEIGGRCVAVRLPGQIDASISVSGTVSRMTVEMVPSVAARLTETAQALADVV